MRSTLTWTAASLGLLCGPVSLAQDTTEAESEDGDEIAEIVVRSGRIANPLPAASYAAPITVLRFDPFTEIQSRGIAEGQSDVTIRGGIFENTGFKMGAVTIMDPQTGHYAAGLGIEPALLSAPSINNGIDNAVEGFNSTIGTVAYEILPLRAGGSISLGAGSDATHHESLRIAHAVRDTSDEVIGVSLALARSEGDGSVPNGDHRFSRYNLQLQRSGEDSQTDLLLSYEDKFYGWPGAYTGFASLAETDDTQTTLVFANHRVAVASGWWELGAYYRRLVDDYDFERSTVESGVPGSFEHETRSMAAALRGQLQTARVVWDFAAQLTSDELVRSTDLIGGTFNDRSYAKVSLIPSLPFDVADRTLTLRCGATLDSSNRDGSNVSPLIGMVLEGSNENGRTQVSLEYVETSQLPGYTALNSSPAGLFGGNPDLGRERAKQLIASVARETVRWQVSAAIFSRRDDGLVDWTYRTGSPLLRQANPVDIDVIGFEAFFTRRWSGLDLAAGYTYLDKDADYGSALVNASFYALNFAKHRATLAMKWRIVENVEFRIDNEYRRQEDNPLRVGDDSTYLGSLSLHWQPTLIEGLSVSFIADNLTDSEYQPFPGTPAAGRQLGLTARYGW